MTPKAANLLRVAAIMKRQGVEVHPCNHRYHGKISWRYNRIHRGNHQDFYENIRLYQIKYLTGISDFYIPDKKYQLYIRLYLTGISNFYIPDYTR